MVWLKTTATERDIAEVVAQIVEHFHPQQVVLFGSYASGTPTPDSDVDLLVVMETPLRNVEQAVEIRKAVDALSRSTCCADTPAHCRTCRPGGHLSAGGSRQRGGPVCSQ